jgi:hypothetical protein
MQSSSFQVLVDKLFPFLKQYFVGVFPLNKIPKRIKQKSCLIFNMDKAGQSGSHWVALVRTFGNAYEIFDSLGTKFDEIRPHLKFVNATYNYNSGAFQAQGSHSCGLFALYFIVHRSFNYDESFQDILINTFSTDKSENEAAVLNFFHTMYC